jgi:hypothetical protein
MNTRHRAATRRIVNLTQHSPTADQAAAGVYDLDPTARAELVRLLTFHEPPPPAVIEARARDIADLARNTTTAMLGGAPFLMSALERELWKRGITPLHAFTLREGHEEARSDGSVHKVQVFRHAGFVEPPRRR